MGFQAEQTVQIINAVRDTIEASQPEPTSKMWLLLVATIPVILGALFQWKRKK